jgi:hypothetical protein
MFFVHNGLVHGLRFLATRHQTNIQLPIKVGTDFAISFGFVETLIIDSSNYGVYVNMKSVV